MSSTDGAAQRSPAFASRVALATATCAIAIASHAVRETARDALFLGGLPAERLPYAYLLIAVGAIVVGVANRYLLDHFSHRRLLVASMIGASGIDALFFTVTASPSAEVLFGLYAWTGLLGTAITMQLWLHLASVFDVGESKRAFPLVTAGALTGAVLGSALAGGLLFIIDTNTLLLASGALLLAASVVAGALPNRSRAEGEAATASASASKLDGETDGETDGKTDGEAIDRSPLANALRNPYAIRITLFGVCIAVLATGVDFVFKHAVSESIPTERLGDFFAWFNTGVNAVALVFELVFASWILRHFGVTRTLMILPLGLLISMQCYVAMPVLLAALAQKFVDGTLRPSLHQAGAEVLFQPLAPQTRNAVKTIAESLGKRGGQALASLGILAASRLDVDLRWITLGLMPVAGLALFAAFGLRRHYVDRFRARLRGFAEEAGVRVPRLDLHSLEALVSNLNSPDDSEVLAAIELLQRYGRTSLIPPLLLHHPSVPVVLRAIDLMKGGDHPYLNHMLQRLLDHPDSSVRAAGLDALILRDASDVPLERLLHEDPSPEVRSTAVVAIVSRREESDGVSDFLRDLLESPILEERVAVARSLPRLSTEVAVPLAMEVIERGAPPVSKALASALAHHDRLDDAWTEPLIGLLERREARSAARLALVRQGDAALRALGRALTDAKTRPGIRRHIPRSIHRFADEHAAGILVEHLGAAEPGVRYKILRGLGRMRADDPDLAVSEEALGREAADALDRAIEMLGLRIACYVWSAMHVNQRTAVALLGRLLADEEERSVERVFRVLHVLDPEAEFDAIFEAVCSGGAARAEGLELVLHLVGDDLREGLHAMTNGEPPLERFARACRHRTPAAVAELARRLPAEPPDGSDWMGADLERELARLFEHLQTDRDPVLSEVARQSFADTTSAAVSEEARG